MSERFSNFDDIDLVILRAIDPNLCKGCNGVKHADENIPSARDIVHSLNVDYDMQGVDVNKVQRLTDLQRSILTKAEMQEQWFELSDRDCQFVHLRLRQGFIDRDKGVDFQGKDRRILKAKLADCAYRLKCRYLLVEVPMYEFPVVLSDRLLTGIAFQQIDRQGKCYIYGRPIPQSWIDEAQWWDWREKEHEKHVKELARVAGKDEKWAMQLENAINDFESLGKWRKTRDKSGFAPIAQEIEELNNSKEG